VVQKINQRGDRFEVMISLETRGKNTARIRIHERSLGCAAATIASDSAARAKQRRRTTI
jgi:hypothetical protein